MIEREIFLTKEIEALALHLYDRELIGGPKDVPECKRVLEAWKKGDRSLQANIMDHCIMTAFTVKALCDGMKVK